MNGGKYLEQNSRDEIKQRTLLKAQIRETYGKVVYSHKTHEKQADLLLKRNSNIKVWQLILSGVVTGSFIVTIFGDGKTSAIIGTIISTILLILNSYTKDFELVSIAEKHRISAHQLWEIREEYLSLLTDFDFLTLLELIERRDKLQDRLSKVYSNAPRTNSKAYGMAQSALKDNEELTFSDREIDLLLPTNLRDHQDTNE